VKLSWDETRAPRVEATIVCRVPTEQATLDLIDPRTGVRVEISVGYLRPGGVADVQLVADLGLRSRRVSRPADTLTLVARSDEALLIDNAPSTGVTVNQPTTWQCVSYVIGLVLPAAPIVWAGTTPGPAVNQATPDADKWDLVNDLRDRIGTQVYDDGLRTWRIEDIAQLGTSVLDLKVGSNGTILTTDTGLDREEGWFNRVYLRYQWESAGVTQRVVAVRSITSGPFTAATGNVRCYREDRELVTTSTEATAAAAALVARMVTRGRTFSLRAIAAYWLRPGMTVTVTLPIGDPELHLVVSVEFDPVDGTMDVTTRLPDTSFTIGA
jgi:hypothetical protein